MITRSTGDVIAITSTITLDGAAEDQTGRTVLACLSLPDRSALAAGTTSKTCTISGSDVTATWPKAETSSIVPGDYLLIIQIDDVEIEPVKLRIVKGMIA
jgi:hypothetical protein